MEIFAHHTLQHTTTMNIPVVIMLCIIILGIYLAVKGGDR